MTERYSVYDDEFDKHIIDNSLKEDNHEGNIYGIYEMCDKLNEQDKQIKELNNENQQLKEALQSAMTMLFGVQSFKIQDNSEYNPLNEFMKEQIDNIRSIEIEVDTEKGEIKKCYKL